MLLIELSLSFAKMSLKKKSSHQADAAMRGRVRQDLPEEDMQSLLLGAC